MDIISLLKAKQYTDEQLQPHKIKIAEVGKELNDFQKTLSQVNVNQEAKQQASGYGMVSLPKNAANGQVSVSVKGITATNIIKNHNFKDGVNNWIASASTNTIENGLLNTSLAVQYPATYQDTNVDCIDGKKVFAKALVITGDVSPNLSLNLRGVNSTTGFQPFQSVGSANINTQYELKGIVTINTGQVGKVRISVNHTYNDAIAGRKIKILKVMAIELVGEDLSLTVDQLNAKYSNYFEGTKSTISASRLKSVGKNLLRQKLHPVGATVTENNGLFNISWSGGFSAYIDSEIGNIKVPRNTNVYFNVKSKYISAQLLLVVRDEKKQNIITTKNLSTATSFTDNKVMFNTGDNEYINLMFNRVGTQVGSMEIKEMQLGLSDFVYEPHINSELYYSVKDSNGNIIDLKSVGTAKDEVSLSEGKVTFRNKKKLLEASDVYSILTTYTNVDIVSIKKPLDYLYYGTTTATNSSFILGDYERKVFADSLENINTITSSTFTNYFVLTVAKGTFTTLTQAQSALTGKELIYQLASEIVTPIEVSGTLLSYPSGTIYVENAVADAGVYNNVISVLHQDLPIKELEKISKIDFMTGVETELDVSQAVIASDKLSFTHPSLSKNDITAFTYFYDKEGTEGEMTIEFYDSRYVVKDSVLPNKFYQWGISVANGVPSIGLVEV